MLAILTKKTRMKEFEKAGFNDAYKLMHTFLDQSEIMQIDLFIQHAKFRCLNLQLALPGKATLAKNIQKTVIFVNSVAEIRFMNAIIRALMKILDYLKGFEE